MPTLPTTIYGSFAGPIDQQTLSRIFSVAANASQGGVTTAHLLFQSSGGNIGDGIALYNYFRTLPFELHLYNAGSIQSIGVLAYLAATKRYVSAQGSFLIHKAQYSPPAYSQAPKLKAILNLLLSEDARIESILKSRTKIPPAKWKLHATQDVVFNAQQAVDLGIADEIREFVVPPGNQIFNI